MKLKKILSASLVFFLSAPAAWAGEALGLSVVKVKNKGSWTEVQIAIENRNETDASLKCCTVFLENTDGYAVASLSREEVQTQIHNKARTPALIGGIVGAGLGLGGLISGKSELGYAALGVGGGSAIASVVGQEVSESSQRNLIIDDVMRNRVFPAGLKVAGSAYFPPRKKWPGSKKAETLHLTYEFKGKTHRVSAPIVN